MNGFFLSGRVASEPRLRTVRGGERGDVCVVRFRLANTMYSGGREHSTFVTCEIWGDVAQKFQEKFKVGDPIYVDGFLRGEEWDDKSSGQRRSELVFRVQHHERGMVRKGDEATRDPQEQPAMAGARGRDRRADAAAMDDAAPADGDDDCPF